MKWMGRHAQFDRDNLKIESNNMFNNVWSMICTYLYHASDTKIIKHMRKNMKEINQSSSILVLLLLWTLISDPDECYAYYCPPRVQWFPESVLYHFMSSSVIIFRRQTVGLSFGNDKICSIENGDTPRYRRPPAVKHVTPTRNNFAQLCYA